MPGYITLLLVLIWGGLLGFYARDLRRSWREPVLRYPVVIFESDDWGAGPLDQVQALAGLRETLVQFKDETGRSPVATLGVILATADTQRIRETGCDKYFSINLSEPVFTPLREAMQQGVRQGVFALHLHGMEHYWPPALIQAAIKDESVREWLQSDGFHGTESLPSPLQTRWVDASVLPSNPLDAETMRTAIAEEMNLFGVCFNIRPRVAVATTFVWSEEVEAQWARMGIDVIVTPGSRYTCREATGKPGGVDKRMVNGELSKHGQIYLVRDVYFEPSLGHTPEKLLNDATTLVRLGRPCLVEMHRFNFMGSTEQRDANLRALEAALERLQHALPDVRFMTSLELADAIRTRTPALIQIQLIPRIRVWLRRIQQIRGFARLARISGLTLPLWMMGKAIGV